MKKEFCGIQFLGLVFVMLSPIFFSGCTSYALHEFTSSQIQSVQDIQYQMVLDNIAMFIDSPGAIPWHITIPKGTATIGDTASTGFVNKWPPSVQTYSLSGGRVWSGDWTIAPVFDTNVLTQLSVLYGDIASDAQSDPHFWVHYKKGSVLPDFPDLSGHYGSTFVRVDQNNPHDYGALSDFTMLVLIGSQTPILYSTNDINLKGIGGLLKGSAPGSFWGQINQKLNPPAKAALIAYDPTNLNPEDVEDKFRAAICDNLNVFLGQNKPICDANGFIDLTNHVSNIATLSLLKRSFDELNDLATRHKDHNGNIDVTYLPLVTQLNQVLLNFGFTSDRPLYPPTKSVTSNSSGNVTPSFYNGSLLR